MGVNLIIIFVVFMVVLCFLGGKIESIIVCKRGIDILIFVVWIRCLVNNMLKFCVIK